MAEPPGRLRVFMLRLERQVLARFHRVVDALMFGSAFWLAHWIRSRPALDPPGEIQAFDFYFWLLPVVTLLGPPMLDWQGFYRRPLVPSRRQTLAQILKASAWTTLIVIVILYFRKAEGARGVISMFVPVASVLMFLKEEWVRYWTKSQMGGRSPRRRVLLVGTDRELGRLEKSLQLGALGDVEIMDRLDPSRVTIGDLTAKLHDHSINAVLIAPRQTLFGHIEQVIQLCELEGIEVWLHADFFQTRISQTTVDDLAGHPMLVFRSGPEATWQAMAKKAIDFVGAAALLLVVGVPFALVAVLVRLTSPGPVFFRQQRAGLNGRPFTMLKFRTMVSNAEQLKQELAQLNEMSGPVFKISNDPRVTPLGRFLRKWSIDELPQLWNVLRGDMSLVGPRPLPVEEVARFDDLAHRRRLSVRPGLTCLWQVSGRNDVRDFKEWVRLDLEYIDNWSLWLDFKILLRTVPAVLTGAGAR
jgi:exopolysaccharide biosynthesis polyprenyl glycosylphosphotransferase